MENNDVKVWVTRGDNKEDKERHEEVCLRKNWSLIGWHETGDLKDKNEIAEVVEKSYSTDNKSKKSTATGQLKNFKNIQPGDIIVYSPLKTQPGKIAVGRATGNYKFRKIEKNDEKGRHTQEVEEWKIVDKINAKRIYNDTSALHGRYCINIGQDILNSLGGQLTIFQVRRNNAVERFEEIMKTGIDPELETDQENIASETRDGTDPETMQQEAGYIITEADQQILRKIDTRFDGHQFEEFIGEILKAEGYTVEVTQKAKDGGVDVLATEKTMLGLENLVCVQTKMTNGRIGPDELRKLQGVMPNFSADYGLLVSWNGFTSATEQEAKQKNPKIKLWGAPQIMEHFYKHYHKLPEEIQHKVPLQQIWTLKPDIDMSE